MQLSPLQLLDYTCTGVSIEPIVGYEEKEKSSLGNAFDPRLFKIVLQAHIELIRAMDGGAYYGVQLDLDISPVKKGSAPYKIKISMSGFIFIKLKSDNKEDSQQKDIVFVNGISLLFGNAREMIANITSRSMHGVFLLPSYNFKELASEENRENNTVKIIFNGKSARKQSTAKKSKVSNKE